MIRVTQTVWTRDMMTAVGGSDSLRGSCSRLPHPQNERVTVRVVLFRLPVPSWVFHAARTIAPSFRRVLVPRPLSVLVVPQNSPSGVTILRRPPAMAIVFGIISHKHARPFNSLLERHYQSTLLPARRRNLLLPSYSLARPPSDRPCRGRYLPLRRLIARSPSDLRPTRHDRSLPIALARPGSDRPRGRRHLPTGGPHRSWDLRRRPRQPLI
jgi:hypothetical protein